MQDIAIRHFGKTAVKKLKEAGIVFIGLQGYRVEYPNGSWGYETAYKIIDGDVGRVLTYSEVVALLSPKKA